MTPKNIDIPPIRGILPECFFLILGVSTSLILIAKGRSKLIAIKVMPEAININNGGITKRTIYKYSKLYVSFFQNYCN